MSADSILGSKRLVERESLLARTSRNVGLHGGHMICIGWGAKVLMVIEGQ